MKRHESFPRTHLFSPSSHTTSVIDHDELPSCTHQRTHLPHQLTTEVPWSTHCPLQHSYTQIPPDLVVKHQAIDIVEFISLLIWRWNIVQTSCQNRKWRCEPLSPSEVHRTTTKSGESGIL